MSRRRWPFVARVLTVSAMLTALLAVAIVMLVVGRAEPVRAAAARTHTSVRTLPLRSSVAAPSSRAPGAPIVPPGLPMSAVRLSRPRHRPISPLALRQAHARAVAHEHAVLRRLARAIRLARLQHDLFVPHRRRSYNRRPRARSSAG